jgi:hypothetical protein
MTGQLFIETTAPPAAVAPPYPICPNGATSLSQGLAPRAYPGASPYNAGSTPTGLHLLCRPSPRCRFNLHPSSFILSR